MATSVHFQTFQEDKMVNFGPIDFLIEFSPLILMTMVGKFEAHISKNMANIVNFQPKIGLDTTFAPTFNEHNSANFYPILTSDYTKMIKAKLYINFLFLTHSLLQGLRWAVLHRWTQNHPKVVGTCPGHHFQPIGRNRVFEIKSPEPPPP